MNAKSKIILNSISLLLVLGWLVYALLFAPDNYTEKHWVIHIVFLFILVINIVFLFSADRFEKEELRKNNDLERKIKEIQAEEDKRDSEQKRKLKLEEKLDELKDKEVERKIRFEKETFSGQ